MPDPLIVLGGYDAKDPWARKALMRAVSGVE